MTAKLPAFDHLRPNPEWAKQPLKRWKDEA